MLRLIEVVVCTRCISLRVHRHHERVTTRISSMWPCRVGRLHNAQAVCAYNLIRAGSCHPHAFSVTDCHCHTRRLHASMSYMSYMRLIRLIDMYYNVISCKASFIVERGDNNIQSTLIAVRIQLFHKLTNWKRALIAFVRCLISYGHENT